jgi:hypothetical protein
MIRSQNRRAFVLALASLLVLPSFAAAQAGSGAERGPFVAYELTEMAMNYFKHFAGEVGYRFGSRSQLRFSVMEVVVSERDLAGWWSASVAGEGVEGYMRGYELHADRFFKGNWYLSANAGYYANEFRHVTLPDRIWNETLTAGIGIGYSRANLFGVKRLHLDFTMPIRYYFNGIEETKLGEATVRAHKIVPNTWVFLGYRF